MKVMNTVGDVVLETEFSTIGEGIVVAFLYKDNLFQFKVKGDKHSNKTCLRDFHTDVHTQARIIRFMKEQDSTNFDYAFGEGLVVITAENSEKFSLGCDQSVNPIEGRASVSYGSKVKKLKHVDNEKLQKINEVAQEVSRIWRLDQMFTEANDLLNGGMADIKNMGKFMKLVITDIIKEESDLIREAGLEPKEISKSVSIVSRGFYIEKLEELAFETP